MLGSIEFWIVPAAAVAVTQVAMLATSVYLHRALAHRSLVVSPVADVLFRAVLWLTTGQRRQTIAGTRRMRGRPMSTNSPEILRDRGRSLEDEFFRREDQRLMQRLSELRATEATREALRSASGITEPSILEQLMDLGIRAETVAALSIVPLVEVAWADGALEAKERRAVVERAGVPRDSAVGALLEAWLDRRPDPRLLVAWTHLVQAMSERLGPVGAARLKTDLLERARAVAAAAGGLFGVGSRISAAEAAMLARLEAAFPSSP